MVPCPLPRVAVWVGFVVVVVDAPCCCPMLLPLLFHLVTHPPHEFTFDCFVLVLSVGVGMVMLLFDDIIMGLQCDG